jgi:hypothetical protein
MGEVIHIPNAHAAIQTLIDEHERLLKGLMGTIDLVLLASREASDSTVRSLPRSVRSGA